MSKGFFSRRTAIFFFTFSVFISLCGFVVSLSNEHFVGEAPVGEKIPVIVMLKENAREPGVKSSASRKRVVAKAQNNVLSKLDEREFELRHKYTIINGFSGEVTGEGLEKLRKDPNVAGIYEGKRIHAFLSQSVPLINATSIWGFQINGENITGKGETICIIDTGIDYNHSDLGNGWGNKVIGGYDFVNMDDDPWDDNGHGTHCAGIAAANGSSKGVAPDTKIVAIKVLDDDGYGWSWDVIAGIDWCVSNASQYNISVISMSLGGELYPSYCDSNESSFASAINTAVASNISVVVATGNDHITSGISSPACIENATPTGSSDDGSDGTTKDAFSSFTNRGSGFPEMLLAPGRWITSTVPGGGYGTWDGTSMATPHVAGSIALIKQYLRLTNRDRTPGEIEKLLNKTGKRIPDSGTGLNFSRIDVYSAIMELNAPPLIVLNKPENASFTDKNYSILNWTCTDPEGKNMTAFVYGGNESADTLLNTTNCSSNVSCTYNWTGLNEAIYYWKVKCNDSILTSTSEIWNFEVDLTPPTVNFISPTPVEGAETDFNTIIFNVSHTEINLDTLILNWNGTPEYYNYSGNYTNITKILVNGFYNYSVWLNDTAGNWNQTETRNLTVNATPPTVVLISPGNESFSKGDTNFTCNATDNVQLESITLYWNYSVWGANGTNFLTGTSNQTSFVRNNLQERNYVWNCLACDNSSNCAFASENSTVTVDATEPDITAYSINPKIVINGSNVSLSVNVTDTHLNRTWVTVKLPDMSQVILDLPVDYTPNITGRHNITFFANDSAGNEVNVNDYFISEQGMQFNSSSVGYNNSGLNVTLRAYFNGILIVENQSVGNVILDIANYTYDLEFSTLNSSLIVLLRGVNLSENNDRIIGFDMLTPSEYLVTYAINNSYGVDNATLNLSYSGTGYGNEDYLGVYRCVNWNFSGRNCPGENWTEINAYNVPYGEYFLVNVSGFSAFSIKQEPYCGDGVKTNGEGCDDTDFGGKTCRSLGYDHGSLSCSPGCEISTGGCGYSGGGSGGGSGGVSYGAKPKPSCFDGIENCHSGGCEEGVDCGGPCDPCMSCSDGIQNQAEEGIDCGGPCPPCSTVTTTTTITTTTVAPTTTIVTTTVTVTSTTPVTTTILPQVSKKVDLIPYIIISVEILLIVALYTRYRKHVKREERKEFNHLKDKVEGSV